MSYGYSLALDLTGCNAGKFTRRSITEFLEVLCERIDMEREDLHFWDYEDDPEARESAPYHLAGVSACQFICTSSIVIHTLDKTGRVFIDLFSCKEFKPWDVCILAAGWFEGTVQRQTFLERGA